MNLAIIQNELEQLVNEKYNAVLNETQKITKIEDSITVITTNNYLSLLKEIINKLEVSRKEKVEPYNKTVKNINNLYKKYTEGIEREMKRLKDLLQEYMNAERERIKREKKERLGLPANVDIVTDNLKINGVKTMRVKKWRVIDINKIPLEYLTVDKEKVDSVRKYYDFNANSPIPGIEFYYEEVVKTS